MKTILIALLTLIWSSIVAFANLGDTWLQNKFRWSTEPIKMTMLDENSTLQSRILVYKEYGAYYFITIAADTVIMESVYCSNKSVEPPNSVFMRYKALLGEGQNWIEYKQRWPDIWWREDKNFGIRFIKFSNPDYTKIECFVTVGGASGANTIMAAMKKVNELAGELNLTPK